MTVEGQGSYPFPEEPHLAEVAMALQEAGHWANVVDDQWRLVFVTDELRRTFGAGELAHFAIGKHLYGPEAVAVSKGHRAGPNTDALNRLLFANSGFLLTDAGGSHEEVRRLVDPLYHDLIPGLNPGDVAARSSVAGGSGIEGFVPVAVTAIRIRDASGRLAGTAIIAKPDVGQATIAAMTAESDPRHLERMQAVARAARRPAAILFADLEASTALAKRLSTAAYFTLGHRWVRGADRCVIDAGGLVGRHVGDGVVAFFLVETAGSESAAAHACITAARSLKKAMLDVANRSDLAPDEAVLRFGLHWGSRFTSATSRPEDEQKSPLSATRSTKQPGSRRARPAAAPLPQRISSSASTQRMLVYSGSIPTTSPTRRSPTFPRPPTRSAATHPPYPSATSPTNHEQQPFPPAAMGRLHQLNAWREFVSPPRPGEPAGPER